MTDDAVEGRDARYPSEPGEPEHNVTSLAG